MSLFIGTHNIKNSAIQLLKTKLKNEFLKGVKCITKYPENAHSIFKVQEYTGYKGVTFIVSTKWNLTVDSIHKLIPEIKSSPSACLLLVNQPYPVIEKITDILTKHGITNANLLEFSKSSLLLPFKRNRHLLSFVPYPMTAETLGDISWSFSRRENMKFEKDQQYILSKFKSPRNLLIPYPSFLIQKFLDMAILPPMAALRILFYQYSKASTMSLTDDFYNKYVLENLNIINNLQIFLHLDLEPLHIKSLAKARKRFYETDLKTTFLDAFSRDELLMLVNYFIFRGTELKLSVSMNLAFRDILLSSAYLNKTK